MSNDLVKVMNTRTGETGKIRRRLFNNPRINSGILVEIQPGVKPFVPELYTPKTEDEFKETYPEKLVDEEPEAVEPAPEDKEIRKSRKKEDAD